MTLATSFHGLRLHLEHLRDAMAGLRLTVTVDKPADRESALVDSFGDAIEALFGQLEEAMTSAQVAVQSVGHPADLNRARHALAACQQRFTQLLHEFWSELCSYDRITELTMLGDEYGGEWTTWAQSVRVDLDRCPPPAYEVSRALAQCWEELAERAILGGVSVNATNIGQQVNSSEHSDLLRAVP